MPCTWSIVFSTINPFFLVMFSFAIQPKTNLTNIDMFLLLFLTILSFWTRTWVIFNPSCVVFDEVHFGNFTNWYTKSEFFYDIHPPLGKMVMFLLANLSEYDGNIEFMKNYGSDYHNPQYIILRLTPAIFSSLCAPLIYLALRFDSFTPYAAFIASFMVICDTSLLTEQRFILSDGMLHSFVCLFLCVFSYTNSLQPESKRWALFMLLSGVTLGAACSTKNTAWGLMPFAGFVQIFKALQFYKTFGSKFIASIIIRANLLIVPIVLIYFLSFTIHFILLPFSGQGSPYLSPEMRDQLILKNNIDSEIWAKRLKKPGLFVRTLLLSFNMHQGNMKLLNFHPSQSRPINWPLLTGNYVLFWGAGQKSVACIGNAFVYYFAFLSIILNLVVISKPKWDISLRYVIGWSVSYFPFFLIPRSMYLYHYLIPLIIGCMSTGAAVDRIFSRKWVGIMLFIICLSCFFGYYLWSSYSYATPQLDRETLIWNDNWIHGDAYHRKLTKSH